MADTNNLEMTSIATPTQVEGQPEQPLILDDGTNTNVMADSSGQIGDAIDPYGQQTISFEKGNYAYITGIPNQIQQKITLISNTIIPLIEKALIELLGSNSAYARREFVGAVNLTGNGCIINVDCNYFTELWIGQDIDFSYIMQDAQYVLETLKVVPNVQWRKCEIDTTEGELRIGFTC